MSKFSAALMVFLGLIIFIVCSWQAVSTTATERSSRLSQDRPSFRH